MNQHNLLLPWVRKLSCYGNFQNSNSMVYQTLQQQVAENYHLFGFESADFISPNWEKHFHTISWLGE
jgi:hypothetical protein